MKELFKKIFYFPVVAGIILFQGVKNVFAQGGVYVPTPAETGLPNASLLDVVTGLMRNIVITFGFIAVIGFVVAAFYYLLSGGDEEVIKRAKRAMKYCIVGVVVALSSVVVIQAADNIMRAQTF